MGGNTRGALLVDGDDIDYARLAAPSVQYGAEDPPTRCCSGKSPSKLSVLLCLVAVQMVLLGILSLGLVGLAVDTRMDKGSTLHRISSELDNTDNSTTVIDKTMKAMYQVVLVTNQAMQLTLDLTHQLDAQMTEATNLMASIEQSSVVMENSLERMEQLAADIRGSSQVMDTRFTGIKRDMALTTDYLGGLSRESDSMYGLAAQAGGYAAQTAVNTQAALNATIRSLRVTQGMHGVVEGLLNRTVSAGSLLGEFYAYLISVNKNAFAMCSDLPNEKKLCVKNPSTTWTGEEQVRMYDGDGDGDEGDTLVAAAHGAHGEPGATHAPERSRPTPHAE